MACDDGVNSDVISKFMNLSNAQEFPFWFCLLPHFIICHNVVMYNQRQCEFLNFTLFVRLPANIVLSLFYNVVKESYLDFFL